MKKKLVVALLSISICAFVSGCTSEPSTPIEVTSVDTGSTPTEETVDEEPGDEAGTEEDTGSAPATIEEAAENATEATSDNIAEIEDATGYENLLEGTKVGTSGSSVYVQVDADFLMFDFSNCTAKPSPIYADGDGDILAGAVAFCGDGQSVTFKGFAGDSNIVNQAKDAGAKSLGTVKVEDENGTGSLTIERYFVGDCLMYYAYCRELDCSICYAGGISDLETMEYDSDDPAAFQADFQKKADDFVIGNLMYIHAEEEE